MKLPIIWIDCETGGLDSGFHSLLTLAAVVMVDDKIVEKKSWKVKQENYTVSPKAMKINKLDLIDLYDNGTLIGDVAVEMKRLSNRYRTVIPNPDPDSPRHKVFLPRCGGHNVQFDRSFVADLVKGERIFHHEDVDTKTIASFLADAGAIAEGSMSLGNLYERVIGKPLEGAHDAETDVLATIELYLALKGLVPGAAVQSDG